MNNEHDHVYLKLLHYVRRYGEVRPSRAKLADGTQPNTRSIFGTRSVYDFRNGFPLLTSKKLGTKGFVTELLWFLRGDTNVAFLHEHDCHIWDEWADKYGELGRVYGVQWRQWHGQVRDHDQILVLEKGLRDDPYSRRHILSAWNVDDLKDMALPPCHVMSQFYVDHENRLHCQMYQRSADLFLGVPWNIASYSLLTHMFAQTTGHLPGSLIHVIGDAHIYENHLDAVQEQLDRPYTPTPPTGWDLALMGGSGDYATAGRRQWPKALPPSPTLWLDPSVKNVLDFTHEHIRVENYNPLGPLKGEVAV